jgi:protein-tyrosine phosphatase
MVLMICTGNICRSPLAEAALRREVGTGSDAPEIVVASAGTRADPRSPVPLESLASASLARLDLSAHRPRLLTAGMLADADLVLGLSREHRRAAAILLPRVTRKAFTVREFARICRSTLPDASPSVAAGASHDRLVGAVRLAAAARGTLSPLDDPDELDIVDPYLRDETVYAESRYGVLNAVGDIAGALRLVAHG